MTSKLNIAFEEKIIFLLSNLRSQPIKVKRIKII